MTKVTSVREEGTRPLMAWRDAKRIADQLVECVKPACERIEIAGSVRRERPEVHDIELVAVPKLVATTNLLGDPVASVMLLEALLPGIGEFVKGDQRYRQYWLPQEIALDLFLVREPAQWGVLYALRTGPRPFSQWLVTPRRQGGALPSYLRVKDGAVWDGKTIVPTPEEDDYFKVLGLEWIPPCERGPRWGAPPSKMKGER